jgi:hypothetical protein
VSFDKGAARQDWCRARTHVPFFAFEQLASRLMPVTSDKPQNWKRDIARSVDLYNDWFIKSVPQAYRSAHADAMLGILLQTNFLAPDVDEVPIGN